MVIGMFSESYLPMINGVVTSIDTLRRELEALGHTVYVFTTTSKEKVDNDPFVIRIKGFNIPLKSLNNFQLVKGAYKKYKKLNLNIKLDLIHIHTEFSIGRLGIKIAKENNIPIVYTFHTMYEDYGHYVLPFGLRHIGHPFYMMYVRGAFKKIVRSVDSLILPTNKVLDMVNRYGVKKPYEIIPTGINLDKFINSTHTNEEIYELKRKYGLENTINLLFIGRISKEKSIDKLIDMFSKSDLKDKCKLLIVGEGPYLNEIKNTVKKDGLEENVIFTGPVPYDEIDLYYKLGDVFVNASTTETQGLTYIEALASSLPLLVKYDTNLDGLIFDSENGLFYNTEEEFKEKLLRLVSDKELRYNLSVKAKESIYKYSSKAFVEKILNVYNKYVAK